MNKTIITVGALTLLGIGGYFAWKKFGKKDEGTDISDNELKSAVATSEDEETPPTETDVENEIDLEAEKKADELEEAADLAEEETEGDLPPSAREERKKLREERKRKRLERKKARMNKRAERRLENKAKRDANKDKRKKSAKAIVGVAIPVVGAGILMGKGVRGIKSKVSEQKENRQERKEERKEKREERKEARKDRRAERKAERKERRGRRRFDGLEDFSADGKMEMMRVRRLGKGCPTIKQFSNEDADFAFNGMDF